MQAGVMPPRGLYDDDYSDDYSDDDYSDDNASDESSEWREGRRGGGRMKRVGGKARDETREDVGAEAIGGGRQGD